MAYLALEENDTTETPWNEDQFKNIEKGLTSGNSKEAYNTLKALTKTQQHASTVIEDNSGNILTESTAVLKRWTQYCSGLYNYELNPDTSLLQSKQCPTQKTESLSLLREELEEALDSLKAGKPPGANNIPSKLLKNGNEATTTVLTPMCQKIWETKEWPKEWAQSLVIPLTKKATSSNVRTILPSAISAIPAAPCSEVFLTDSRPRL